MFSRCKRFADYYSKRDRVYSLTQLPLYKALWGLQANANVLCVNGNQVTLRGVGTLARASCVNNIYGRQRVEVHLNLLRDADRDALRCIYREMVDRGKATLPGKSIPYAHHL